MKKIINLLVANLFVYILFAQQELHIHHINIENGDATMIGIFDVAQQKYTSKILIDGGRSSTQGKVLPYIKKIVGTDQESIHFQYLILTHYHNDHYTGLLGLKTGKLTADSIIDPGGYNVSTHFKHDASSGTKPAKLNRAKAWLRAIKTAARDAPNPFVKGRSLIMLRYDTGDNTSLGNKIILGTVGSNVVELECIAGWGNTLSSGGQIESNPFPNKDNGNNFTLAFILSCGQFRYFIGGDMGGESGDKYIDQETPVTKYLNEKYPKSFSWTRDEFTKGHICGFKANHHGSNHSNTSAFMEGMHPSIAVTSAGDNSTWHLPHPEYLNRLSLVQPVSDSTNTLENIFSKGIYFTNLNNFTDFKSLDAANELFKNKPGISYDFGNNNNTAKGSYLIKVSGINNLDDESLFEVGRVDINLTVPYKKLAMFFCHKK